MLTSYSLLEKYLPFLFSTYLHFIQLFFHLLNTLANKCLLQIIAICVAKRAANKIQWNPKRNQNYARRRISFAQD